MENGRLTIARWLLDSGAGRSALHALGDLLGQPANELRRLAPSSALAGRRVFALVTLDAGRGAAVPLVPSPGRSRARDPELRTACDRALAAARALLGAPNLPALRFELEEWLSIFGGSLGLPAALAFIGYYAPSRLPARAVLATGRLTEEGGVAPVDGMAVKLAVAEAERGDKLILTPELASSLEAAVRAVFGPAPLRPERHVLTLDQAIARARVEPDRERAIAELEALAAPTTGRLGDSDRARLLLELGTLCRHAGESGRAAELHAAARELLEAQRRFLGADDAERYELECWLSEMDAFRIDEAIEALSSRMTAPFLNAHNEVRCRGMLAQALGMAGRHAEAVEVRAANVELQQASDALRAVLPGTYCYLALDSAKCGDAPGFERWARALFAATPPGNEIQWAFNAAAIVRGLVALGRDREALAWVFEDAALFGARLPASVARGLHGSGPIGSHPETSLLRALCRAFRRTGDARGAVELAARVPIPGRAPNLLDWLCALVHLEATLAGGPSLGVDLGTLHPAATRYHAELTTARGAELERAIDRVWY